MQDDDPVFDYYLWHPRQIARNRHTLDIVPGDKWNPPTLDPDFLDAVRNRLNIAVPLRGCTLSAGRTPYYSDPDARAWDDIWRVFWTLECDVEPRHQPIPAWQDEYLGLIAFDPESLDVQDAGTTSAVIYADFANGTDVRAFQTRVQDIVDLPGVLGYATA